MGWSPLVTSLEPHVVTFFPCHPTGDGANGFEWDLGSTLVFPRHSPLILMGLLVFVLPRGHFPLIPMGHLHPQWVGRGSVPDLSCCFIEKIGKSGTGQPPVL